MKIKEKIQSPLYESSWWYYLNNIQDSSENCRYAFSLFLQTFSAPTFHLRRQALTEVMKLGVPESLLAEEAILNDDADILKEIKGNKAWSTWERKGPSPIQKSEEGYGPSLEEYLNSIEKIPLMSQWILECSKLNESEKVSRCVQFLLEDKEFDPTTPIPLIWHSQKLSVMPIQKMWTPLAYTLVHQNFEIANQLLKDTRIANHQQSLDEALLVLWALNSTNNMKHIIQLNEITLRLLELGANSNKPFEFGFDQQKELLEERWIWSACAGVEIVKANLLEKSNLWDKIEPFITPEQWPVSIGPVKEHWKSSLGDFFASLQRKKTNSSSTVNFEALEKLVKAPFPFSHEDFLGETLLTLLKVPEKNSEQERIKKIQALNNQIGCARFHSHDSIWSEILKRVTPKTEEMLNWAQKITQSNPSLKDISYHWNPKNLKEKLSINWFPILSEEDQEILKEIQTQFHQTIEPILNMKTAESEEKIQLFLSTLSVDKTLPKPKSLRL